MLCIPRLQFLVVNHYCDGYEILYKIGNIEYSYQSTIQHRIMELDIQYGIFEIESHEDLEPVWDSLVLYKSDKVYT